MKTPNQNSNRNVLRSRLSPACVIGMAAIGIVMMGTPASAQFPLFDSLDYNANEGHGGVNSNPGPVAFSFSTGATPAFLTDVKTVLSGTPSSGGIIVELLSDSALAPGSVLTTIGTLSDNSLSSTPTVEDFSLATPYALATNTRYWIELTYATNTTAQFSYTFTDNGPGVPNEYYFAQNTVFSNSTGPDLAEVIAVPEPASCALLFSLGMTGAAFLRNRSRKK